MSDLLRDLERHGQELDATVPPISIEELRFRHATAGGDRWLIRPVPAWAAMVAAAAAVLLVVGGLSLFLGGSEGSIAPIAPGVRSTTGGTDGTPVTTTSMQQAPTTVSTQAEPEGVFEWGDTLSEWVTEDEMTALLEDLSQRYYADTGGDLGGRAVLSHPGGDLIWSVGHWSIGVHAGGGWHPTPDLTDPRLPDGALYSGASQSYGFSGPNSNQAICITLTTPGTTASIDEEPNYEQIFFEVASMLLEEMGWTGEVGGDA